MKRQCLVALAAFALAADSVFADTEVVDGITWTYTVSNGQASLGGGSSSSTAVPKSTAGIITVPSLLDGYPVVNIGWRAFSGCSGLMSVTIPDSVVNIGRGAFSGCSGLKSVRIPDSVTNIDYSAFSDCSGLISVTIPDRVTSIGSLAFSGCSGLMSVTIPDSVTSIGSDAFSSCSEELYDTTTIPGVTLVDGWVVGNFGNHSATGEVDLTKARGLARSAFLQCQGITSVTIGNQIRNIATASFQKCFNLKTVTIPNSVTNIGENAFLDCGLTSVSIPEGVVSIGKEAFKWCDELTSVTIPDSIVSIGDNAFDGCNAALYDITTIPGVKLVDGWIVGHDSSLSGDLDLTGCRGLGNSAFKACADLSSVEFGVGIRIIGESAFSGCTNLATAVIPDSVTSIGDCAFDNCHGLSSVSIGDGVVNIGWGAFSGCSGLKSVTIPDSVTNIDYYAFFGCSGLTSVTIPDSVANIDYVFCGCSGLTSVRIPDSIVSIGASAFRGCSGLASVKIPDSVTSIGDFAFYGCSGLTSVRIPDSIVSIGDYAFSYCSGLTSITIPDSVTSIGDDTFRGCSGLTSVTIPGSVTNIGFYAFYECNKSAEIRIQLFDSLAWVTNTINFGLSSPKRRLFVGDEEVTSIDIPEGVPSIEPYIFRGCSGLTSITIPDTVTSIGDYAFFDCSGLTSITIPDTVTSIGEYAFSGCSGLTSITIPDSVTSVGNYAFSSCSGLTSITIPDSVTSIGDYAFSNCSELTSVTIPDSVTSIGSSAFFYCPELTSITIPNALTNIGSSAFSYCSGLTSITIPDSVTSIGSSAFSHCSSLTNIAADLKWASVFSSTYSRYTYTILGNPMSVGYCAFYGCSGLTSITIPDSVTSIGDSAFYGCSGMTSITIPRSVTSIGYRAFSGCSGLTSITIPNSVTSIGDSAFYGCSEMTSITIPRSVTSIGNSAFYNCFGLMSITIPDSVTSIGRSAFYGCSGLRMLFVPESWEDTSMLKYASVPAGCEIVYSYYEMDDHGFCRASKNGVEWIYKIESGKAVLTEVIGFKQPVVIPTEIYVVGVGKVPVVQIAGRAFEQCENITAVLFPGSLETIAADAFSGCENLRLILAPFEWEGTGKLGGVTMPVGCEVVYGAHTGTLMSSQTWDMGTVHVVGGKFIVPSGVTLTIAPGAVVKFTNGASLTVSSGGACIARDVVFTHVADDTAGGDTMMDGDKTAPAMGKYAIYGTVTDDDSTEYRYMPPQTLTSSISSDTRLRGHRMYVVSNSVTVASGATLTLPPGTVLKFNTGCKLTVNGSLVAHGTRASPVVFTSLKDDDHGGDTNADGAKTQAAGGDWNGLWVYGRADLAYTELMYSGNGNERGIVQTQSSGILTMTGCTVAHAKNDGIWNWGGSISVTNTIFADLGWATAPYRGSKNEYVNCVFIGNDVGMCYWSHWSGAPVYRNCVFMECAHGWCELDSGSYGAPPPGVSVANSLFFNPVGFGTQSCSLVGSSGNVWGDPLFLDPDNGDFRIAASSPCVDAGDSAAAPELDYYGQPRMDVKFVQDTGVPNADGVCADIGLYEVPGNATVPMPDIVPVSISFDDGSLNAGSNLSLSWKAASSGETAFSGTWRDRILLVDESSVRTVDLGTVVSAASMPVGSTSAFSGSVRLPADAEGTWRVALHLNSARDVWEGANTTNNVLVSDSSVTVTIPPTAPADGVSGTASADAPGFAKVAAGGEALIVRVSAPAGTVVYLGADYLPSAGGYTARAVAGADGAALVAVPAGADAAYLVVESATGAPVAWSASFESGSLAVSRVSVPTLPYAGAATLGVTGAAFSDGCTAALVRGGAVAAGAVAKTAVLSTTTLSLTLDCSKLAQGAAYDLRVTAADGTTATLKNAVAVAKVPPKAQLKASLDVPATVRRGRTVTVWIDYENVGNAEMPAPVFEIVSQGQVFQVGDTVSTNSVMVMGLSAEAPVGALRPGEPQRLGVKVTLLSQNIQWILKSHHALQDGAKKTAFSLRELYDDDWVLSHPVTTDSTVAAIRAAVGSTRADFYATLATWLSENEPSTIDYETLKYGFARYHYQKASGLLGSAKAAVASPASIPTSSASTRSVCQHGEQHVPGSGRCTRGVVGGIWKWCPNNGGHWFLLFRSTELAPGTYSHEPMFGDGWSDTFDPSLATYLICHGNANSIDEDWIADMARALTAKGSCNVLAVNWGQVAFKGLPHVTAAYIPDVVDRSIEQLALLGIATARTTVIGHSHGAHVGANIITRSSQSLASFKRFVGLDTSTTDNKVHDWNSYAPATWIGSIRARTQVAEFYKSSFDMSLEESGQLYGDYNFLVFRSHDYFEYWTGGAAAFDGDAETERHGVSHQWFIRTIQNASRYAHLGFNFTGDDSWKVLSGDKIANPGQSNFAGIIRDDRVEMLSPLRTESGAKNWNYGETVLSRDRWGDAKAARWFRKNLIRTIDYRVLMDALPKMDVGGSAVEFAASGSPVEFKVRNNADNLTVDYGDPNKGPATDRSAAPWKNDLAHGVWLIDYESLIGTAKSAADSAISSNGGIISADALKSLVANKANVRLVGDSDVIAPTISLEPSSWFEGSDTRFTYPQSNDTVRVKVRFKNAVFGEDRPLVAETDENGDPTRYRECLLLVGAGMNAKKAETAPESYEWDINTDDNFLVRKIAAVPKEFRAVISVMESAPAAAKAFAMRSVKRTASPGSTALADGEVVPVAADENGNWSISLDGYASISTDADFAVYSFELPDASTKPGTAVLDGKYTRCDMPWTTVSGTLPSTTDADGNLVYEGVRYAVKLTVMTEEDEDDTATCILDVRRSFDEESGEEEDSDGSREVQSCDPNEMAGPEGAGADRALEPGEWATYTIYFENKADAEAAAASVSVEAQLSDQLDWSTFRVLAVGFGNNVDLGLAGKAGGRSELALPGTNVSVRTDAALDPETGVATWQLRIVDPDGDEDGWPRDVFAGFLPPNDPETHCGEGYITYRVNVREDATPNARIDASATIVFDYNEPIETDPSWWNTVAGDPVRVTFDARGNARPGAAAANAPTNGVYYVLPGAAPVREGYSFVGWALADGTILESLSQLPAGTKSVSLRAVWAAECSVAFDANGGVGEMNPLAGGGGEPTALPPCAFTRTDHAFVGWTTRPDGEVRYLDGSTVAGLTTVPGATETLYAVWADTNKTTLVRAGDNLQTAVDTAPDGGLVLVYPGTYAPIDATGRVLEIRAVFGPDSDAPDAAPTVIDGGDAVRCATLDEGVVLSGFTLRNGVADNGGGVKGGALENCRIEDCAATVAGGGAWGSALSRCTVSFCRADRNGGGLFEGSAENTVVENCDAALFGGGAFHATLTGCTVYGCGAETGAGVAGCTVRNSIVWENRIYAVDKKGVHKLGNCANVTEGKKTLFKNACTYTDSSPKPAGTGNLAKTPLFVDAANGDFRLQWTSPVKNKGRAALSLGDRDLGGLPRRIGAPDMGAHEVPDGTPVPADYDGDGIADAAYFDAPTATWIVMQSRDGLRVETFGDAKATPVPADYDGDGTADFATYSATAKAPAFRIRMQLGSEPEPVALGLKGATPLAADLDGDGKADPVVFQGNAKKPSFTAALSGGGTLLHVFGTKGAKAVAGDFDGDGKADIGCYTASASKPAFAMLLSGNNWDPPKPLRMTLGAKGSEPCCGDFDGDGLSDFAAYAGSAKTPILYRMFSTSRWRETRSLPFGEKGSRAATGDWDGDGVADPAIETHGTWWRVTRDWEIVPITAP